MRKTVSVVLGMLLAAIAAAQDFGGGARRLGAGDYASETGGALVGGVLVGAGSGYALGLAGWYLGGGPTDMDGFTSGILAGLGAVCGVAIGYPLGCGLGATLVGRATYADGNTGGAYGGAYIGMLVATIPLAAVTGGSFEGSGAGPGVVAVCVAALLPPVGAVIGYNLGGGDGYASSFGTRVSPPAVAISIRDDRSQNRCQGFDCRLVTVRF